MALVVTDLACALRAKASIHPRVNPWNSAKRLKEINLGGIKRFKNESKLAVYCGVACIDDDSGKKKSTKEVYKATMIDIAGCTIRYIPESIRYYAKKRAEGKEHNHALRCLARQLIKVIFKMLNEDRDFILKEEIKKAA